MFSVPFCFAVDDGLRAPERHRHQSSSARSTRCALHSTEFLQEGSSDHARHCAKHLGNLGETRIKQWNYENL